MPVPVYDMSNGIEYTHIAKKKDYHLRNEMIYVGRLGLEKGVDVVVKAFALAHKKNPALHLDIYGDGPAKDLLHELVKQLGIEDSVGFVGFVSRAVIKRALKRHDFFVTASTMETQGLVILEAMSAGLPVLGVDALAVPDLIHNGKNGYLVEPKNYKQMAEAMLKLNESKERNKQFGQASLAYAEVHDIPNCVAKLERTYADLIASTKSR
jgi:glycosyltransferase involved in cell wall biosynthesis